MTNEANREIGPTSAYLVCGHEGWTTEAFEKVSGPAWTMLHEERGVESALLDTCLRIEPSYVFFLHWSRRIPETVYRRWECVNFHCTPLPYGRGGHPIENMILNGHESTVITAHRVTEEIDAGPIYAQSGPVSLLGGRSVILSRFVEPCAAIMDHIARTRPEPTPQHGVVTTFKRLSTDEWGRVWQGR